MFLKTLIHEWNYATIAVFGNTLPKNIIIGKEFPTQIKNIHINFISHKYNLRYSIKKSNIKAYSGMWNVEAIKKAHWQLKLMWKEVLDEKQQISAKQWKKKLSDMLIVGDGKNNTHLYKCVLKRKRKQNIKQPLQMFQFVLFLLAFFGLMFLFLLQLIKEH